jgi:hypothetical protein
MHGSVMMMLMMSMGCIAMMMVRSRHDDNR